MLQSLEKALGPHLTEMARIHDERQRIGDAVRRLKEAHDVAREKWKSDSVAAALAGEPAPEKPESPELAPYREARASLDAQAATARDQRPALVAAAATEVREEARDRLRGLIERAIEPLRQLDELTDELRDVVNALRTVENAEITADPEVAGREARVRGDDLAALLRLVRFGEHGVEQTLAGTRVSETPGGMPHRRW